MTAVSIECLSISLIALTALSPGSSPPFSVLEERSLRQGIGPGVGIALLLGEYGAVAQQLRADVRRGGVS